MPNYDKKRILIADDDGIVRELLKAVLREGGHEAVGEALNGEQVIEMAGRLNPDVVCLDIHMPKMDGLACLAALKAAHPDITVVMISGDAKLPMVQQALAKGAKGFIVKPFNAGKVLDTIQRSVTSP